MIRKIDLSEQIHSHKVVFLASAVILTVLAFLFMNTESAFVFAIMLVFAVAATIVWIFLIDWALMLKCPRCGTILRGVKTETITKHTRLGTALFAIEHYRCPRCKLPVKKRHPITKPLWEKEVRMGIHKYWRFR